MLASARSPVSDALRPVFAIGLQLLLVGAFDALDGALWVEQDVVGRADVAVQRRAFLALEEVRERVGRAGM